VKSAPLSHGHEPYVPLGACAPNQTIITLAGEHPQCIGDGAWLVGRFGKRCLLDDVLLGPLSQGKSFSASRISCSTRMRGRSSCDRSSCACASANWCHSTQIVTCGRIIAASLTECAERRSCVSRSYIDRKRLLVGRLAEMSDSRLRRGRRRAEFRMNVISDVTWINAASSGPSRPTAASAMPTASTTSVPEKFCQMILRLRRATSSVSTNRTRSLPSVTFGRDSHRSSTQWNSRALRSRTLRGRSAERSRKVSLSSCR
jgi:hypothetical protein